MNVETPKVNGAQVGLFQFPAQQNYKQSDMWMFSGKPASDKRRRVRLSVSPSLAKLWLDEANEGNRLISEFYVTQYACDMLDGRWQDNGDTIRFDRDGKLLDGQHRLKACLESKVVLEVDVVFGLEPAARETMDIGHAWRASDVLRRDGILNSTNAGALASMLITHRKYGIQRINNRECSATKTEIFALCKSDPRISEVAGRVANWGKKMAPPRALTFCYYLFSEQDAKKADLFFHEISKGIGISPNTPTYELRERLIRNASAKAKLPLLEVLAIFFKAWSAYRTGKQVKALRWITTGATPEKFPEI